MLHPCDKIENKHFTFPYLSVFRIQKVDLELRMINDKESHIAGESG